MRLHARRTRHDLRRARHRVRARLRPWWQRFPMEFLRLRHDFPVEYGVWEGVQVGRTLVFRGEVEVPTLPKRRRVAIAFPGKPSTERPIVMVSGPRRSRHRFVHFRPTSLCLYYGPDPTSMKWDVNDGLAGLIDLIRQHLFKEEWWRATGTWPGMEVHLDVVPARPGAVPRAERPRARIRRERLRCWCGRGRYSGCHGAMPAEEELHLLGIDRDPGSAERRLSAVA
jgi:hypothetical protein